MKENEFDKNLKKSLQNMTTQSEDELENIKLNVQRDLKKNNYYKKEGNYMKRNFKVLAAIVCVFVVSFIFILTPSGQELAKRVFENVKSVLIREGDSEDVDLTPSIPNDEKHKDSSKSQYLIYYDSSKLDKFSKDDVDYYIPAYLELEELDFSKLTPDIAYMKVEQVKNKNIDSMVSDLKNSLENDGYTTIKDLEDFNNNKATGKIFQGSTDAMMTSYSPELVKYQKVYCIDNQKGGVFVITILHPYDSGYMEGWNSVFSQFLETFEVIK